MVRERSVVEYTGERSVVEYTAERSVDFLRLY
jgi:hypothetical protein